MFTIVINQTLVVSKSVNIRVDVLNTYKSDKQYHTEYWSSKTT